MNTNRICQKYLTKTKKTIEHFLRPYPTLFSYGSRFYYRMNRSFITLSPGAPEAIFKAFRLAKEMKGEEIGDYYEFGLFRGYTFLATQETCSKLSILEPRFYGFDSFQGLPAVEGIDQTNGQFFGGQFACRKEDVVGYLTDHGVDWSRTVLIDGFFEDSLTLELKGKFPFKPVAVSFIDCDLYSSTREVLHWLSDLICENSIILFDDWYAFGNDSNLGQQKAFREFLDSNPNVAAEAFLEWQDHGLGFVIHRR
jgi:hypothetical protein